MKLQWRKPFGVLNPKTLKDVGDVPVGPYRTRSDSRHNANHFASRYHDARFDRHSKNGAANPSSFFHFFFVSSSSTVASANFDRIFQQLDLPGNGNSECALVINGPGRSSHFDYTLNLLRGGGNTDFNGHQTCITYDAVNAAYLDARKRIHVGSVGEVLLDISMNLARTYGLSYEDIEKGLPLIDTSKTLIREICPPFLANVECVAGKYRRFDGLCTNLEHPTWGATNTPFTRLMGPLYSDGMHSPRISGSGRALPPSRVVSRTMHPDEGFHDHAGTVMIIAWGQFIDHDFTLQGTPLDPFSKNDPEECCGRPAHLKHPYCNEIIIPEDDYFYRLWGVKCIDFVRTFPSVRPGCRLGSKVPFNTLTGVLDANTVKLRSGVGGLLRMNPAFEQYGLKDLLPLKLDYPDEGCTRPNATMYCFEAGEIRVNEQLVLTVMHTLMAREHNRLARGLAEVNPHWDDETLFQEARRINIGIVQHITYNEFLPILLGKDGYWNGYDSSVNPGVIDAFAAAAYRFGHSLLPTAVERWSKAHKFIASKRLSDLIRRPHDLYRAGILDEYVMGLMNQVAQAMDDSITQEVTNHLFKKPGARFGMDLVSFNMQRGREFGLPGYMEFRKFCGLPWTDNFDGLFGAMPNETIYGLEEFLKDLYQEACLGLLSHALLLPSSVTVEEETDFGMNYQTNHRRSPHLNSRKSGRPDWPESSAITPI
ncbi:unnamed protein product [Callosobruchus maculatus]|uniref:Uncharacterized protein n=1 Tax=Callosobruchus maculatus TaxID=64391 RepID=A0A653BRI1_CALMS|nr:unnamed protein product [Callosobruchus maculatus]